MGGRDGGLSFYSGRRKKKKKELGGKKKKKKNSPIWPRVQKKGKKGEFILF